MFGHLFGHVFGHLFGHLCRKGLEWSLASSPDVIFVALKSDFGAFLFSFGLWGGPADPFWTQMPNRTPKRSKKVQKGINLGPHFGAVFGNLRVSVLSRFLDTFWELSKSENEFKMEPKRNPKGSQNGTFLGTAKPCLDMAGVVFEPHRPAQGRSRKAAKIRP